MLKEGEQKEKAVKSIALMRKAEFGTLAVGGDLLPDEDTALRYYALSEISPSSVVREAFQNLGTGLDYEIAGIRQKQTVEMDAETIEGQSVHIFRMEQTMPEGFDPTGMQKAINDKMYGPDGIVQRIVLKDNFVMQTMGGGSESMKRLMTAPGFLNQTVAGDHHHVCGRRPNRIRSRTAFAIRLENHLFYLATLEDKCIVSAERDG